MTIDVAICTWNRSGLLARTLERLLELRVPSRVTWRVLVVNNNSTDDTAAVLQAFSERLPLRTVLEPQAGLSRARNRAVLEAQGEYLVWTDDDVLVDREWLAAYSEAFARHPDAAFFGGPIHPWFEGSPPAWLQRGWRRVGQVFAVRELGGEALPFDDARFPFGANFAVRTAVQRQFPYDPSLGRLGQSMVSGDETTVLRAMLAAGHKGWWVPEAKVVHFIPRSRQTLAYVRRFFEAQGEVQSRSFNLPVGPRVWGRPRWLVRRAVAAEARYRWSRVTSPPEVWLDHLAEAAISWGQLKAAP